MAFKRIAFWLILAIFVVLSVVWMHTFPFNPQRLYATVSDDAILVSHHVRLADRWPLICDSPMLHKVAAALAVEDSDLKAVLTDKSLNTHLRRILGRETVVAYSRPRTETLSETIMIASWVGAYGQYLRWGFLNGALKEFESTRLEDGSRIWQYRDSELGDRVLSLSVFEGVAVACLSRDPIAAARSRRRMVLGAPVVVPLNPQLAPRELPGTATAWDRAWMRDPRGEWTHGGALTQWTRESILGVTRTPSPILPKGRVDDGAADALVQLLANAPDAVAIAAWQDVAASLKTIEAPPATSNIYAAIEPWVENEAPVFAALLGGDYSGRVMKLRVPSLVIGLRTNGAQAPLTGAEAVLDTLNAVFGLGLIPKRQQRHNAPFIILDSIKSNGFGLLAPEERPALAAAGDWLLVGSNARALELLLEPNTPRKGEEERSWVTQFPSGGAAAFAWSRTAATADAITKIKAVAALAMIVNNSHEYERLRPLFDKAQKWIDLFGAVGETSVAAEADGNQVLTHWRLRVDTGDI